MILLLKGFIIGLAKIIPGVSGSLVALNLGLYEKCIDSISSFKKIKQNISFLTKICIGVILAIMFGSKIISFFLYKYYFITMIVFIGLLIGSDINNLKNIKNRKEILVMIITFFIMFILFFIKTNINYVYKDNFYNNLYVVLLGFVDASTMIIPAVSGTVIFMILGSYDFVLMTFANVFSNLKVSLLFFVGLFLGIILVSKVMNVLLSNKQEIIYPMINGFFLSSILYLIMEVLKTGTNYKGLLISIPIFIISYKIGTLSNR